jgi:hypothetical protein
LLRDALTLVARRPISIERACQTKLVFRQAYDRKSRKFTFPRLASTHLFSPLLPESANAACAQVCEPHHHAISTSLTARRERPLSKRVADKSKNQKIITRHTQRGILVIKRNENERLNFFLTFPEFFSKINYPKFGQMPLSVRL